MLIPKQNRVRDVKHRRWIVSLGCIITGNPECQAAHVSKGRHSLGWKIGDNFCLPLQWELHLKQHRTSEEKFWIPYGGVEKAQSLARDLYAVSGDYYAAIELIRQWRTTWTTT